MPTVNRRLMLKIAEAIELHPDAYDQHGLTPLFDNDPEYVTVPEKLGVFDRVRRILLPIGQRRYISDPARIRKHSCGTPGCIAGWAVVLSSPEERAKIEGYDPNDSSAYMVLNTARQLLGLTFEEAYLFNVNWKPSGGRTVPHELRRIANGGPILLQPEDQ